MSESSISSQVPRDWDKLLLCAKLAQWAYSTGNPDVFNSEVMANCPLGIKISDLERFYSHSWLNDPEYQHRFFKCHAYVCQLDKSTAPNTTAQIVVAFRGTWLHEGATQTAPSPPASNRSWRSRLHSKISNIVFYLLCPSNYGLADLYYNATLIRVPYREGTVWKWFAYWGTRILEGSNWCNCVYGWPRKTASGLLSRPRGDAFSGYGNGLVHLGFWALWAAPEGFAGYDRNGYLWEDQKDDRTLEQTRPDDGRTSVHHGILQNVAKLVCQAKSDNQNVEILVVGHSLGGAVSW
jgi:hypothetical protein